MHSSGISGEGGLRGNWLTQVRLEKWPLKWSVCDRLLTSNFFTCYVVYITVLLVIGHL